ncbi:MAG: hypothetical protein IJT91_07405 [Clostridia bacterium]|nr:hypothetical protein [Clostridia bacterium]
MKKDGNTERILTLFNAVGDIGDDLISGAAEHIIKENRTPRKKKKLKLTAITAAALAAVVLFALIAAPGVSGPADAVAAAIYEAEYPDRAEHPDLLADSADGESRNGYSPAIPTNYEEWKNEYNVWEEEFQKNKISDEERTILSRYFRKTAQVLLSGTSGKNALYSPVNTYFALAMLAETAGGKSRSQILGLLGSGNINSLRDTVGNIWQSAYNSVCRPANSIWLESGTNYKDKTFKTLAEKYYASSFRGHMGSDEYNGLLRDWLNVQTNGILRDSVSKIGLSKDTVMAIASTLYLKVNWHEQFSKNDTVKDVFHAPGGDAEVDFMRQKYWGYYYSGKHFSAVQRNFVDGIGSMWLILPNEDSSIEEVIADGDYTDMIDLYHSSYRGYTDSCESLTIRISLPKFDITSENDLCDHMPELGISKILDPSEANFSPIANKSEGLFLSKAEHDVRVRIDEEGLEAAAVTVLPTDTGAPPRKEIDFNLNRPFIFVITSSDGIPLFAGAVNEP